GALAAVLAEGGKLSTYSAKGSVRRAMLAAGLHVSKHPGPPGKREMLVGHQLG
ncbi:MAG: MnmC family methyltransferase, partial [Granulosicoccus sp.]